MLATANIILFLVNFARWRGGRANLVFVSYCYFIILGIPGSYVAATQGDWWLRNVSTAHTNDAYLIYNSIAVILSGILFLSPSLGKKRYSISTQILVYKNADDYVFLATIFFIFTVSLLFLFPNSALQILISSHNVNVLSLAQARAEMNVSWSGSQAMLYFKNLAVRYLIPFSFSYFAIQYVALRKRACIFYFAFGAALFCAALDLAKAPIMYILLIPFFAQILYKEVNIRSIAMPILYISGAIAVLYSIVMGQKGLAILVEVSHRIFVAQYVGFPLSLQVFPDIVEHPGWLGALGAVSTFFGNKSEFFSLSLMKFANPDGVANGVAGYVSTVAFAEGYALSGYAGILLSVALVASFILLLERKLASQELKSAALYLTALVRIPPLVMDSTTGLILNYGLYLTIAFVLLLKIFNASIFSEKPCIIVLSRD